MQLKNNKTEWKHHSGIQILKNNFSSEEYFDALLKLMDAFRRLFIGSSIAEKISKDINLTFELWSSRILAEQNYEQDLLDYKNTRNASEKHIIISRIIEYLNRRNKSNYQYRNDLVSWCEKDVSLYLPLLIEFYIVNKEKNSKNYMIPQLKSYDILHNIYEQEENNEKLIWLKKIGSNIGYRQNPTYIKPEKDTLPHHEQILSAITHTVESHKSGLKGKLAFLDTKNNPCSTEEIIKEYLEHNDWKVMRAEVNFWQAMFCLSFWEEIFGGLGTPVIGNDIPQDMFSGEEFYLKRQHKIDYKFKLIQKKNLREFINKQMRKYRSCKTRFIYNGPYNMIKYFETHIVQTFLEKIDTESFAKILYHIAQNPSKNRAGLPDFIIWNDKEVKLIEVKRLKENLRESQLMWIAWMLQENIPIEIYRVKGI